MLAVDVVDRRVVAGAEPAGLLPFPTAGPERASTVTEGVAEAPLVGGNLALLAATLARVVAGGLAPGAGGSAVRVRPGADRAAGTSAGKRSSARRILDARFATGELSASEYEHRRAVLSEGEEES